MILLILTFNLLIINIINSLIDFNIKINNKNILLKF